MAQPSLELTRYGDFLHHSRAALTTRPRRLSNKNKKSVKFQGDTLNFYDFIQVFVFTTNHLLKTKYRNDRKARSENNNKIRQEKYEEKRKFDPMHFNPSFLVKPGYRCGPWEFIQPAQAGYLRFSLKMVALACEILVRTQDSEPSSTSTKTCWAPHSSSYKVNIEFRITLIQIICDIDSTEWCFTVEKFFEVIESLRNKKAADLSGLSAEPIKYGGDHLIDCLRGISNRIVNTSKIPKIFKQGAITPVYKKQGKPLNDPNYTPALKKWGGGGGGGYTGLHLSMVPSVLPSVRPSVIP